MLHIECVLYPKDTVKISVTMVFFLSRQQQYVGCKELSSLAVLLWFLPIALRGCQVALCPPLKFNYWAH